MKIRELIGTAAVPGGGELRLFRRGDEFIIALGGNELMSSRMSGSEEALATMSCDRLRDRDTAQLLIGGFGMGFTLRAALAMLGPQARITMAELVPEIIEWARGPMAELAAACLDDPRVDVVVADVSAAMAAAREAFDAILLDVDNGPDGLVRWENNRLYSRTGLAKARDALKPGGILAVWSAAPDPAFRKRLYDTGLTVTEWKTRSRPNNKGAHHVIWFAQKA